MDDWAYGLLAVGILFIIAAMFSLGRSRNRQASTRATARDHVERARQKQGVRDELEALMVDINRMAKDLGGQLDAKIVRIEQATREADERIAQLQALKDTLSQPAPYAVQPPPATAELVGDVAGMDAPQPHPASQPQADSLTREVYALADSGLGPGDIAEQLGEHVGKVELILALRSS